MNFGGGPYLHFRYLLGSFQVHMLKNRSDFINNLIAKLINQICINFTFQGKLSTYIYNLSASFVSFLGLKESLLFHLEQLDRSGFWKLHGRLEY